MDNASTGIPGDAPHPEQPLDPSTEPTAPPAAEQQVPASVTVPIAESSQASVYSLRYAVELLIFAFVGWGWLSVREYISATPVMDVVVLIMVLATSVLNMVAVILCRDASQFAPFAQAYFSHALALTVLYAYSLAESLTPSSPTFPCTGGANASTAIGSLALTYREAFFGGLPLHQVASGVTMAYLAVLLMLSAAQARACDPLPGSWLLRGTSQSTLAFVAVHLALFINNAPMANKDQDKGGVPGINANTCLFLSLLLVVISLIVMVDFAWLNQVLVRNRTVEGQRTDRRVQLWMELLTSLVVGVFANVLSSNIFGFFSWPLFVLAFVVVSLCSLVLLNEYLNPYAIDDLHAPSAPPKTVAAFYSIPGAAAVQLAPAAALHGRLNFDGIFARRGQTPVIKPKRW